MLIFFQRRASWEYFFLSGADFFGGYDGKLNFLEHRGVQMILCVLAVFLWEFFVKHQSWYVSLIVAVLVYIFFCKSHWYYFKCGTEDDSYIDEQLKKGRNPAMNWLVKPINKFFGFEERSRQYCFVGLMIRYFIYSLPVAWFVGWQFAVCGFCIPFIYNAMFWVNLPKWKLCGNQTNWAEFFNGLIIGWALW